MNNLEKIHGLIVQKIRKTGHNKENATMAEKWTKLKVYTENNLNNKIQ